MTTGTTIAVTSQKGRWSEATLAIHLAPVAQDVTKVALTIDMGPQAAASHGACWRQDTRPGANDDPPFLPLPGGRRVSRELSQAGLPNLAVLARTPAKCTSLASVRPQSWEGRKQIAGLFTPETSLSMDMLARHQGCSLQALMAEAFGDGCASTAKVRWESESAVMPSQDRGVERLPGRSQR